MPEIPEFLQPDVRDRRAREEQELDVLEYLDLLEARVCDTGPAGEVQNLCLGGIGRSLPYLTGGPSECMDQARRASPARLRPSSGLDRTRSSEAA